MTLISQKIEFTHLSIPIMETATFRTKTEIVPSKYRFGVNDTIFLIGSCFVESVGSRLADGLLSVECNPFGTVYNPVAIQQQLERIIKKEKCTNAELVSCANRWHSKYAHGLLSASDAQTVKDNVDKATMHAAEKLAEAKLLVVTFGTAWIYRLIETAEVVANCHKMPSSLFRRELLTVDEIVQQWNKTITNIRQYNNDIKILFTVSPIRHLKETSHGNQISKATLLLAIDKLVAENGDVDYFPSYEIMLDDLRDYRFYAEDMVHPSSVAVDYIYDLFASNYLNVTTLSFVDEAKKVTQALKHRPVCEDGAYHNFMLSVYVRTMALKEKYDISDGNEIFASAVKKVSFIANN